MGMTATERLRQLLDERGVEWAETRDGNTAFGDGQGHMRWAACVGAAKAFFEVGPFTPEQAVEATLGRGTCNMEFTQAAQFGDPNDVDSIFDVGMFRCTACGTETYGMWNDNDECREWPRYCPNCGRRVES